MWACHVMTCPMREPAVSIRALAFSDVRRFYGNAPVSVLCVT